MGAISNGNGTISAPYVGISDFSPIVDSFFTFLSPRSLLYWDSILKELLRSPSGSCTCFGIELSSSPTDQ